MISSALALPTALELGTVTPGTPSSESVETGRLVTLVSAYNSGLTGTLTDAYTGEPGKVYFLDPAAGLPAPPNLPAVGSTSGHVDLANGPQTGFELDLGLVGYAYALIKWGNTTEYYYIGGLTGAVIFNNDVNGNGASHYSLYNLNGSGPGAPVPEGSNTIALLGLAALGMVAGSQRVRSAAIR